MTQETGACPRLPQRTGALYEEVRFQDQPALFTSLRLCAAGIPKGCTAMRFVMRAANPARLPDPSW